MIVKVAVSGPFLSPLDYVFDEACAPVPVVGGRVRVPFRNRTVVGLVMGTSDTSEYDVDKLKKVEAVLDEKPLFSQSHLTFIQWAAHYYHEPIGEVVQSALPKKLRAGEPAEVAGLPVWKLTEAGRKIDLSVLPKNARHQQGLLTHLQQCKRPQSASQLNAKLEQWRPALKKFIHNGWVEESRGLCFEFEAEGSGKKKLNNEQQAAVEAVCQLEPGRFATFLLEGITGSGKTEVYLGMIDAVLKRGQQALVLVPEIGLTPQMVDRFAAHLNQPVALMHSGLNDAERHCAWHLVRSGQVKVLLGTRSAVFAPFQNLGLAIIDEEHDLSFKQQEGFRYSARDLLIRRGFENRIPVVLGSATPSIDSLHNVEAGRYRHLVLKTRAANAQLPAIKLLDVRGEKIQEGVSRPLQTAMQSHLQAGDQVLLFLNRRGFAPVLMCHECGWQAQCPSCDANMTFHQSGGLQGHLRCHHCGYQAVAPQLCPSCQSTEFVKVGQGTERLTETIQAWFPDKKVVRIDRDTTRQKGKMAELTGLARSGEADILIGTQMLAKGHHFPHVTLVGLLDIDQGLFGVDFRAPERMAQLILQVAGRAGRGEKKGEVLIQTHHPDHPMFAVLLKSGYSSFAKETLRAREKAHLPPFCYQVMVRAEANQSQDGMNFLNALKATLKQAQETSDGNRPDMQLWGPVPAPMERRQGRYRYQLLLQSESRSQLHYVLGQVEPLIYKSPLSRKVRWSLDVDPQEMN